MLSFKDKTKAGYLTPSPFSLLMVLIELVRLRRQREGYNKYWVIYILYVATYVLLIQRDREAEKFPELAKILSNKKTSFTHQLKLLTLMTLP